MTNITIADVEDKVPNTNDTDSSKDEGTINQTNATEWNETPLDQKQFCQDMENTTINYSANMTNGKNGHDLTNNTEWNETPMDQKQYYEDIKNTTINYSRFDNSRIDNSLSSTKQDVSDFESSNFRFIKIF